MFCVLWFYFFFIKKNTDGSLGLYHEPFIMTCKYLESGENQWGLHSWTCYMKCWVVLHLCFTLWMFSSRESFQCSTQTVLTLLFLGNFRGMIPEVQSILFPLLVLVGLAGASKASLTLWSLFTDICLALIAGQKHSVAWLFNNIWWCCFCRIVLCLKNIALKQPHQVRNCSSCPYSHLVVHLFFLNHCNLIMMSALRAFPSEVLS